MKGRRSGGRRPGRGPHSGPRSDSGSRPTKPEAGRWVIGHHAVAEAINVRPRSISKLWLRDNFERSQDLMEFQQKAKLKQIPIEAKASGVLDKLGSGNQGVACLVTEDPKLEWSRLKDKSLCTVLALDGLEDPHNLGSILRTAWLSNVDAILIPSDRSVGLTPTVAKIASGGAEHVPVEMVSNLGETLKQAKDDGFWIFGLAEEGANKLWEMQLPERLIWVVGSEASGLRTPIVRACDELVQIPQAPTGSSFNASIAAALALYETSRQRAAR